MFCSIVLVRQEFGVEWKTVHLQSIQLFMDPSVECCVKYSVKIELMWEKYV